MDASNIKFKLGWKYFVLLAGLIVLNNYCPHFLLTLAMWTVALPLIILVLLLSVTAILLVLSGGLLVILTILEFLRLIKPIHSKSFGKELLSIFKR